ncbi:DNA repair protein complementing XP-G cells -like protein, partial [Asbolus verrucosus]
HVLVTNTYKKHRIENWKTKNGYPLLLFNMNKSWFFFFKAKRNQQKAKTLSEADRIHRNLLSTLLKHSAISKVLSEKAKAAITSSTSSSKKSKKENDDLYMLPAPNSLDSSLSSSEDESSNTEDSNPMRQYELHSIDTQSSQFKSLPVDVRHEILTDLKDTRKQSSWGRIHELPSESDDFSVYQMRRLLKRQSVQSALEEVEKEMGGHSLSLGELEIILKDQGVISKGNLKGSRIASDENTRFLLIKDIRQAVENAKKQNDLPAIEETGEEATEEKVDEVIEKIKNKGEIEFEDELQRAIALSLEDTPSTSQPTTETAAQKVKVIGGKGKNKMPLSFLENFEDARFDDSESSEEETLQTKFTSAQKYMMEYSTLTSSQINKIIATKGRVNKKNNAEEEKKIIKASIKSDEKLQEPKENAEDKDSVEIISNTMDDEKMPKLNEVIKGLDTEEEKKVSEYELNESINEKNMAMSDIEEQKVSKATEDTEEKDTAIEIMSDSELSSCDDFVDVEDNKEKTDVKSMEVVIKPDEEMEDDIFKDIFANEDKPTEEAPLSSRQEEIIKQVEELPLEERKETTEEIVSSREETQNTDQDVKEPVSEKSDEKSGTQTLKDKIERMIKSYSKISKNSGEGTEKSELSVEQMNEMRDNLRKEEIELVTERSNKERLAGNITDQMCQEAQELLELFGVPYLIAPMEAEAQCAFLDLIDLTDGTITDDSDIWLFGGRTVYKNFFNQSKTVLEFKSENIQHHYKLTREQMILLAMLVGSDYTVGLTGIGPVTALEILAAFPPKNQLVSGLAEFKSWCNKGKLPGPGRTSLRSKLKNLSFTENFPNSQIAQAYLQPQVETSKEKFSWAKPDVVGLVEFARQKFGWTKVKTEEILGPILKRLEDHSKQKSILDYFKSDFKADSGDAEKKMSKRVKTAINKIGKNSQDDEEDEESKPKKKKQTTTKRKKEQAVGEDSKTSKRKKPAAKKKIEADEDIEALKHTEATSRKRIAEIQKEVLNKVEEQKVKKVNLASLHRREVIPQKQKEKTDMLKNKLKAIETFRKSKQGPGYVKKKVKVVKTPKEDASYLSESSSSD